MTRNRLAMLHAMALLSMSVSAANARNPSMQPSTATNFNVGNGQAPAWSHPTPTAAQKLEAQRQERIKRQYGKKQARWR